MVRKLHETPIAIIGMASAFPQATNLREFWDNIVRKADCIEDVPESRWKIDDYYDEDPTAPDKTYSKRGGFIPELDFDPMEFGLPPNILEVTDVSQMIGLVVARDALLDSGYIEAAPEVRDRIGVVLGVGGGQKLITPLSGRLQYPVWRDALKSSGIADDDVDHIIEKMKKAYIRWEENSFPGMLGNVIAGRIANRLDLGGMNCVVDAACASSMAAMKLAVSDLVEGRADMMITGGVDTDNSIFMYMCFSKTPAFTPGDVPRPFDETSDGMMIGEGVGMLVLKRLEDAERDGDRVYAVLRGIGTSSDGRYKSIYAPRGEGQEKALARAYEDAGISPADIQLIEAHGTGTKAGDMTETTTVSRFYNKHMPGEYGEKIAVGSVKSNIGHTKAAAGIAGLIKACLALHHKVLPATINVTNPNPKLGLDESPVYVNTETRPWIANGKPRRAGVSSFGFGGTNFHFVLEEHRKDHTEAYRLHNVAQTLIVSAANPAALTEQAQALIDGLQGADAETSFYNLIESSGAQLNATDARLGFAASTPSEAAEKLQAAVKLLQSKADAEEWQHPKGIYYRRTSLQVDGRVVALFSGQGSQYVGMGRELALGFPAIRESYGKIDTLFEAEGMKPVSYAVYPPEVFTEEAKAEQDDMIRRTDYVQPAIGALSAGMYNLLRDAGFAPNFVAGHSFGELTALWASGAINDDDYYKLVKARGLAMAPPADPNFNAGTMMAVTGDLGDVSADVAGINGVHVANMNSPKQVVLAGKAEDLENAKSVLTGKGYNVVPLPVAAAFHTPLVGHAQRPFADAIKKAKFHKPSVPVYSNATATAYPDNVKAIQKTLEEHILNAVNFRQEVENLYAAGGYVFVEFGPRSVLTNLVKETLGDRPHVAVSLNASRKKASDSQFSEAVAQLRVLGLALNAVDRFVANPAASKPAGRRKGMKVKIHGGQYISDKTRQNYQDALNDGHQVAGGGVKEVIKEVEVVKEVVKEVRVEVPSASTPATPQAPAVDAPPTLEEALAVFSQQQSETLQAHQQYLANQAEYIKLFTQLAGQQQALAGSLSPEAATSLNNSINAFHEHQAETLRVHEVYLQRQAEQTSALLQTMRGGIISAPTPVTPVVTTTPPPPAPVVPVAPPPPPVAVTPVAPVAPPVVPAPVATPAPAASDSGLSVGVLSDALLDIVSEKTGYPTEMLELEMDIEADLGIDSIKRVEILGAMRDQFPSLPQLEAEELAELRTLEQIVDYMKENSGGGGVSAAPVAAPTPAPVASTPAAPVATPAPVAATPAPAASGGLSVEVLSEALLDIVSEKTGYPTEMLELEMDIEADLGIDSIKRVEILGAMRDQFPSLPQLEAEELAELRTLEQIVDYMKENSGGGVSVAPVAAPVAAAPAPVVAATPAASGGLSVEVLSDALLNIVSEKTGYPTEMLELEMDIEADLGIDSIKRVEILGAMRDQFPSLPQLEAEELAELRTLEQIVDYMKENSGGGVSAAPVAAPVAAAPVASAPVVASTPAPVAASPAPATSGGLSVEVLSEALLDIVSEKTGYPTEMLELEMDIEADLGIDSIKRVEILGAMRDQFPSLPQLEAEELAELRTLEQIVDYMKENSGGGSNGSAAPVAVAPVAETPAPAPVAASAAPTASDGLSVSVLSEALLDIVSEKTGYPTEMLELEMDIEADLGIDSIKRVEILGAMRDQFPSLPQLEAEELAELRTLEQIVDYMKENSGGAAVASAPKAEASAPISGVERPTLPTLDHDIPRIAAALKFLPSPDAIDIQLPANSVALVTDDGTALTAEVISRLTAKGMKTVVLSFPSDVVSEQSNLPAGTPRVELPDMTETRLQESLDSVSSEHGEIAAFIHVNPPTPSLNGSFFLEHEKALLKHAFLLAKHLKKPLNEAAENGFGAFMAIMRLDGQMGTTDGFGAISGGLFGLVKTVNLEWPHVFCRAVDLAPSLADAKAADLVMDELHDPNRLLAEVAYNENGRSTLVAAVRS